MAGLQRAQQGPGRRELAVREEHDRALSTWWHRRIYRRIAARGGYIAGSRAPASTQFTPAPVNAAAQITWVVEQAAGLAPAIDEMLGNTLDNAINARADQWIAQVQSEFAQFIAKVRYAHGRAEANIRQEIQLQSPDELRIRETQEARDSAAFRLSGEHGDPAWIDEGHADPTLLAGRPRGGYLYLVALLIAASADIVAFYQVVELIQGNLTARQVAILVVGFTAIALGLAHYVGVMLRDRKAGARWIEILMIFFAGVCWIVLGALAFWVRLESNLAVGGGGYHLPGTLPSSSSAQANPQGTLAGAAMFAGLYLASGAIALIGGYLHRNPLLTSFMRAMREHRKAAESGAISARRLRLAEAERDYQADQIAVAERVRDEAIRAREALAAELKQHARMEFAKRLRDASATDAFFEVDARPYTYRPSHN